jgi:hypothetical protein
LRLGQYDKTRPLHIETSLSYSTYLGGTGRDNATLIAVDSSGGAYLTGLTMSTDYPSVNPAQPNFGGDVDVFVSKLNPSGTALDYSTYLGGTAHDEAWGIIADSQGSAYVVGYTTSTDFPTANAFQPTNHGDHDAFVARLSPSGNSLLYSTYLGGTGDDEGWALAVSGNTAYVTGKTNSPDFPTLNPLQPSNGGGYDFFISRLTATGSGLLFSTYLGDTGDDEALGIATDPAGNAYVAGGTSSYEFPVPNGNVYQPYKRGGRDAVLAKLSPDGRNHIYTTYLGGSSDDLAWALAVRPGGEVVLTGGTGSDDFPTRHAVQSVKGLDTDAFVTELSSSSSWMIYSTFLGGNGGYDASYGAAVDSAGNSYVSGITDSTDFPTANAIQPTNAGYSEGYLSMLGPGGRPLLFSTYLGGFYEDWAWGMAVDAQHNIYTTGTSRSFDFPVVNAFQPTPAGNDDNIVVKVAAVPDVTPTPDDCSLTFSDVPLGSTFYPYIHCLACDGIISGYPDNTFRPNNNVTRGQLSKIVSNAAGYYDPMPGQIFQDLPITSPFFTYTGQLAYRAVIAGYPCGGPSEPCIPPDNMPYFRPNANLTRGQAAKIVAKTAAYTPPLPGTQTFEDVPPTQAFYTWIEQMASRDLINGYPCGGPDEPCVPPENRPYFRPSNTVTRGQAAKIVANAFYQECVQSQLQTSHP